MGGGDHTPVHMKDEDDDMKPFIDLTISPSTPIKHSPPAPAPPVPRTQNQKQKQKLARELKALGVKPALLRELKALGIKPMVRPDYTKELDEPTWEIDGDEEDVDFDTEGDAMSDTEEEDRIWEFEGGYEDEDDVKSEGDDDDDADVKSEDEDVDMKL